MTNPLPGVEVPPKDPDNTPQGPRNTDGTGGNTTDGPRNTDGTTTNTGGQ